MKHKAAILALIIAAGACASQHGHRQIQDLARSLGHEARSLDEQVQGKAQQSDHTQCRCGRHKNDSWEPLFACARLASSARIFAALAWRTTDDTTDRLRTALVTLVADRSAAVRALEPTDRYHCRCGQNAQLQKTVTELGRIVDRLHTAFHAGTGPGGGITWQHGPRRPHRVPRAVPIGSTGRLNDDEICFRPTTLVPVQQVLVRNTGGHSPYIRVAQLVVTTHAGETLTRQPRTRVYRGQQATIELGRAVRIKSLTMTIRHRTHGIEVVGLPPAGLAALTGHRNRGH